MFGLRLLELALNYGASLNWSSFIQPTFLKRRVIELDVRGFGHPMEPLRVQHVGCHLPRAGLPRHDPPSKPLGSQLPHVLLGVIWCEWFLIKGFENGNQVVRAILQEITS